MWITFTCFFFKIFTLCPDCLPYAHYPLAILIELQCLIMSPKRIYEWREAILWNRVEACIFSICLVCFSVVFLRMQILQHHRFLKPCRLLKPEEVLTSNWAVSAWANLIVLANPLKWSDVSRNHSTQNIPL